MRHRGFTLVELLVAISIILVMATLAGSAYSTARLSAKASATRSLIEQLNSVVADQLASYDSMPVDTSAPPAGMSAAAYRAWYIRRNFITGDMPDRWENVEYMYNNTDLFPDTPPASLQFPKEKLTPHQKVYLSIWRGFVKAGKADFVKLRNSSAECLFMAVMQGGLGDCLGCEPLRNARIGDTDLDENNNPVPDGAMEFIDAWGNPIGFLLWAPALVLPPMSGRLFFSGARSLDPDPFAVSGRIRPTLGMWPLIYSGGPDGKSGYERNSEAVTLSMGTGPVGRDCGNPAGAGGTAGGPLLNTNERKDSLFPNDNVTNLDLDAKP